VNGELKGFSDSISISINNKIINVVRIVGPLVYVKR